jgi:hypothetical protein
VSETVSDPLSAPVVRLANGPEIVASLGQLEASAKELDRRIAQVDSHRDELIRERDRHIAMSAVALVSQPARWDTSKVDQESLGRAIALQSRRDADESAIREIAANRPGGLGGLVSRAGSAFKSQGLSRDEQKAWQEEWPILWTLAHAAPEPSFPEADGPRARAREIEVEIAVLDQDSAPTRAGQQFYLDSIKQRNESIKQMGFDSHYLAAYFTVFGPEPISVPLVLKKGEVVYGSAPASLARMTKHASFAGGSSGMSFPIGHTGIRYRVGSFRGHPISTETLDRQDTGTLIVTNQRIAFVGQRKAVSVLLAKLINLQLFTDGLSLMREGREAADYYLMSGAGQFVFTVNLALAPPARSGTQQLSTMLAASATKAAS